MKRYFLIISFFLVLVANGQESSSKYEVKSIYLGKMARINFKNNPVARVYRARISKNYKQNGVNFAGHYSFVFWGCGSPCTGSVIVDAKTDKVYSGPDSGFGYNFTRNSRLLIVNPKDTVSNAGQNPWDEVYKTERWFWNDKSKNFIKLN